MSICKYIYWRKDMREHEDGRCFANIHLLKGYNQGTITDFQAMADELRQTFPQATNDEIHCGTVSKSSCVNGFSIVTWNAHILMAEYPGWSQPQNHQPEYHF